MMSERVAFNTQRSIRRFMDLQTGMSSGRRINKPSDDPVGTVRDLGYRNELTKIEQHQKNISTGLHWVATYETSLADMNDIISSAKEIAVAMSNGTYDENAREASANEIQSIFNQMIQLGNTELEGRRIFGGFKTTTKPLEFSANGVIYRGDSGKIDFEIDSALKVTVNSNGSDVFLKKLSTLGETADLNLGVTGTTTLSDLNNGNGINLAPGTFTITDKNLNITSTIDVSAAVTLNDAIAAINAQLAADGITSITASLGSEGNNIRLDTTQTGIVASTTALGVLNNGNGVDLTPGKFRLSDGGTTDIQIDMSGAQTIGDAVTAFNTQVAAAGISNVTMSLNAGGTGFDIVDSNPISLGLSISETNEFETTAGNLGLIGLINPALAGVALNPSISFEITETTGTTAAGLGIKGNITSDFAGSDLDPVLRATSLIANLKNRIGIPRNEITIWQGEKRLTVDLGDPALVTVQDVLDKLNSSGLAITASINAQSRGIQIANNDPTRSLTVEDGTGSRTAKDMGIFGSSDMMGSLLVLNNALRNDDQEGAGILLKNLDDSILHLLNERAMVGARTIRFDTTRSRHEDKKLSFTRLLSEVEDADLPELVTRLATYESNYRAALLASAKIIQPTLMDFLSR